ncbi:MAG TPA: BON domain-containing protein [Candidatus Sulfotelmatobacter sp.]|nr:BON domain-containing protein [Candidatus Sulfotelmatobacter sp.]
MNRTSQHLHVCLLVLILSLATACARKPDDTKISADIQNRFSLDSGLAGKQLSVQASNGVVTLAGTVDNDAQRDAASRQAGAVPGVKEVINNLQVGTASQPAAAPETAANAAPAAPEISSPAPAKKRDHISSVAKKKKARGPDDSSVSGNSANGSGAMNSRNPSDSNAAPQIAEIPPASAPAVQTPPPPPPPKRLIIDQGTQLSVRLVDPIDSEKNQSGDTFHATLNTALSSDGEEAVPVGAELTGHLVDVKSAGKFKGQSAVVLQLDNLTSGGKTYSLQTDQYRKEGSSRGKNTAEKVGGGAIIGGIIGAIAGGGKGAAIGSAAGAGVGAGAQEISKSQQIKLASETVLNFTLQAPITVVQAHSPDANRPKLSESQR